MGDFKAAIEPISIRDTTQETPLTVAQHQALVYTLHSLFMITRLISMGEVGSSTSPSADDSHKACDITPLVSLEASCNHHHLLLVRSHHITMTGGGVQPNPSPYLFHHVTPSGLLLSTLLTLPLLSHHHRQLLRKLTAPSTQIVTPG